MSKKKNLFFADVNVQSIPKADRENVFLKPAEIRFGEDGNILTGKYFGWDRSEEKTEYFAEVSKLNYNIRNAFIPYGGHLWVSIDFSSQELRIPANLSKDPVMLDAFKRREDYHKRVAIQMYGAENYNKTKRKIAKCLNFNVLYGGGKGSVAKRIDCSPVEADIYIKQWWGLHKILSAWAKGVQRNAKKNKVIYTAFGRPRRLKHWYESPEWKTISFADRTAVNQMVQGAAADIMRIALIRVYNHILFDARYRGKVILLSTIHDEINFSIEAGIINEVVPQIQELMEIRRKDWEISMETSVEIGPSWGDLLAVERAREVYSPVFIKD